MAAPRPTFDIVRVEPGGDAVIAGRAEPDAAIELLNRGVAVARTKAGPTGEFVFIPDNLAPGAHQLSLRARVRDREVESDQAVAVAVPQAGGREVVVALAEPDKPTVILSETATPVLVAPEPGKAAQAPAGDPKSSPRERIASLPPSDDPAVMPPSQDPAATPPSQDPAATPPSQNPAATPPSGSVRAPSPDRRDQPAPTEPTRPGPDARPQAETQAETQAGPRSAGEAAPPAAGPVVRIRVVEAEQSGGFFVSGFAAQGARVRIYLNGSYIAEVEAGADGNWSMRVNRGMSAGAYDVRADVVDPASGKVLARAEVPFAYPELVAAAPESKPKPKSPATRADAATPASDPQPAAPVPPVAGPSGRASVPPAASQPAHVELPPAPAASPQVPEAPSTPPGESRAKVAAAPSPEPGAPPQAPTGPLAQRSPDTPASPSVSDPPPVSRSAQRAPAGSGETPNAAMPADRAPAPTPPAPAAGEAAEPPAAQTAKPRAAQPVLPRPDVARIEAGAPGIAPKPSAGAAAPALPARADSPAVPEPDERSRPDIAGVSPAPGSGGESPPPAAHVVIERVTTASVVKGDSLWRISRNVFGRGIRYTQIYAANTDQIRDPNLIFPGQVLVVPLDGPAGDPASP